MEKLWQAIIRLFHPLPRRYLIYEFTCLFGIKRGKLKIVEETEKYFCVIADDDQQTLVPKGHPDIKEIYSH